MCKNGIMLNSMLHISLVAIGCKAISIIIYDDNNKSNNVYCKHDENKTIIENNKSNKTNKTNKLNENNKSNYDYAKLLGPF